MRAVARAVPMRAVARDGFESRRAQVESESQIAF